MSHAIDNVIDYENPRVERPVNSRVIEGQHDDGLSYTFVLEGFGGAMRGLIGVGVLATAVLLFPALMLLGIVSTDEGAMSAVLALVVVIPMAALALGVVRAATRATVLSVRGGRVTLFSGAALYRPVKSWAAEEIDRVTVNLRGVSGRLRLLADLNLRTRQGTTVLVIAGRDRADLEWAAQRLREAVTRAATPGDRP